MVLKALRLCRIYIINRSDRTTPPYATQETPCPAVCKRGEKSSRTEFTKKTPLSQPEEEQLERLHSYLIVPIVSIVVPFWGYLFRIPSIELVKPKKGTTMETIGNSLPLLSSSSVAPPAREPAVRTFAPVHASCSVPLNPKPLNP